MAAKKKLDELSDGELADRFGEIDVKRDKLVDELKPLKEEFERRKLDFAKGEKWKLTKDVQPITRFDTKAAKTALGKDAAKYEKPGTRTEWVVRPVEAP